MRLLLPTCWLACGPADEDRNVPPAVEEAALAPRAPSLGEPDLEGAEGSLAGHALTVALGRAWIGAPGAGTVTALDGEALKGEPGFGAALAGSEAALLVGQPGTDEHRGGAQLLDDEGTVWTLWGETSWERLGDAVALGELAAVSAPMWDGSAGRVILVEGVGELTIDDARAVLEGTLLSAAGRALAWWDGDGDGVEDLAVGAPQAGTSSTLWAGAGGVYVLAGPLEGHLALEDAALLEGERASAEHFAYGDLAGAALATGDLDGDGLEELLVGAPLSDRGRFGGGAVYAVAGLEGGELGERSFAELLGAEVAGTAGASLAAGDLDGDGALDLAVGAPRVDDAAEDDGWVHLARGPLSGTRSLADVETWRGPVGGLTGAALAVDGEALLVGAPGAAGAWRTLP